MNTEQIKEVAESLCNLTSDYVHGSLHAEADNHWKAGLMQVIMLRLERLLGSDNATDHGAAIEAAAKQTVQDIEQRLSLETRQQIIARNMRALLVATVTNPQQKGGEQREALAAPACTCQRTHCREKRTPAADCPWHGSNPTAMHALLRTADDFRDGMLPAAPATQELTSHPEGAATTRPTIEAVRAQIEGMREARERLGAKAKA